MTMTRGPWVAASPRIAGRTAAAGLAAAVLTLLWPALGTRMGPGGPGVARSGGLGLSGRATLSAQERVDSAATVTVEGEVLDAATGVPVAGAIFAVPALGRSTFSDDLGYFRLAGVPAGLYGVSVMRLGYETLSAEVPLSGLEVLAMHLSPGPVSLEGIEVEVISREDLNIRAMGISARSIIGPVEMEELRERYFSLEQVLTSRYMPRSRFQPSAEPGQVGCLMVTQLTIRGRSCAALVVDGVLLNADAADWVYRLSTDDIFSVRFLHGPAAALRYGHRGSDGVLMIETRVAR